MPYDIDYNKNNVHDNLKNDGLSSFSGLNTISYQGKKIGVLDIDANSPDEAILDGNPPISKIIENSADLSPADFLYTKDFGKVPTNRLVICRRYHYPVHDILPPFPPLSKMITWLNKDVENIIPELSLTMNFEDTSLEEASVSKLTPGIPGLGSTASESFDFTGTSRLMEKLNFSSNMKEDKTEELLGAIKLTDNAKFRSIGQNSEISFEYKFSYKMKYIDGVDPKLALLDALANALVMCYDNTRFFKLDGGQKLVFEKIDQYKYYDIQQINAKLGSSVAQGISDIGGNLVETIKQFDSSSEDASSMFDNLIAGSTFFSAGRQLVKRLYYLYTFMTGAPSGFWHLTIGNPFNPIAVWGNLICSDAKIKFSKELAMDDFPDGFDIVLTLVPARPLSRDELMSKFNNAKGGLYKPPTDNGNDNVQNPEVTNSVQNRWLKNQVSTEQGKYTRNGVQDSLDMHNGTHK